MQQSFKLPSLETWEHWSSERLLLEQKANPRAFARGFQMKAFTDDERMFPSFKTCFEHGVVTGEVARRGWPVFVGVDLAGPKRVGNVIFAAALDPSSHRRYPLEVLTGAWTSPETARQLAGVASRHQNLRHIMVENNGYQQAIIDWIRSSPVDHSFWYKIESFTTGMNKSAPDVGLPSLEIEFKNKAWVVPAGEFEGHPPTCRCGWCTWVAETTDYPLGQATDTVMAMWFCREAISRWGVGVGQKAVSLGDFNMR